MKKEPPFLIDSHLVMARLQREVRAIEAMYGRDLMNDRYTRTSARKIAAGRLALAKELMDAIGGSQL